MTVEMKRRFLEDGRRVVEVVLPDGMDFDDAQRAVDITRQAAVNLGINSFKSTMRSAAEAVSAGLKAPVGVNDRVCGGIPLRLHIAARLLAGLYSDDEWLPRSNPFLSVLKDADKLIAAHNETCGDK